MAKLTLQFKGKPIDVFLLEADRVTVGRDPDNNIVIDSLAIAPHHVSLNRTQEQYTLQVESEQFSVLLNDKNPVDNPLNHGDRIQLGKHILIYSEEETTSLNLLAEAFDLPLPEPSSESKSAPREEEPFITTEMPTGNLQILNGSEIGRLITLHRRVTELPLHDLVPAIVARRPNGYFVSRLLDEVQISIDGNEITNESALSDGSVLMLDDKKFQFFFDPL